MVLVVAGNGALRTVKATRSEGGSECAIYNEGAPPAAGFIASCVAHHNWRFKLENLVGSDYTIATDQIIRYPAVADASRYTFSLSAFPEATYGAVLTDYFAFCKQYYEQRGYRTNMLNVGYWIAQDRNSLLSYSYDGGVMTIDPVSTGSPGRPEFLTAYNQFCSAHGGIPLFNQTDGITPTQVQLALGDRLKTFAAARPSYDPTGRLLNAYFREMLGEANPPVAAPIG